MEQKLAVVVPAALIAFSILSHLLAFVAQVFADIHKDEPGVLKTLTDWVAKGLNFLNGIKGPQA